MVRTTKITIVLMYVVVIMVSSLLGLVMIVGDDNNGVYSGDDSAISVIMMLVPMVGVMVMLRVCNVDSIGVRGCCDRKDHCRYRKSMCFFWLFFSFSIFV